MCKTSTQTSLSTCVQNEHTDRLHFIRITCSPLRHPALHSASLQETSYACLFHSLQPDPDASRSFRSFDLRKIPKRKSENGGKISTKNGDVANICRTIHNWKLRRMRASVFLSVFYPFLPNFFAPFLIQNSPGRFQRTQILLENRTSPAHRTIPHISNVW